MFLKSLIYGPLMIEHGNITLILARKNLENQEKIDRNNVYFSGSETADGE